MGYGAGVTNGLRRWVRRLLAAGRAFGAHDGAMLAAAMAYYVALSFFPLLLVLVAGLGVILRTTATGQDAEQELLAAIEQQVSPELSDQVARALDTVSEQASAGGPIGFFFLVLAAVAIFAQFDRALDRIWEVADAPDGRWWAWIRRRLLARLKAFSMLLGAGAFMMAASAASIVWSTVKWAVEPAVPVTTSIEWCLGLVTNVVLNVLAFSIIYRFVPKPRVYWRHAVRGAGIAALLWEVGRQLLAVYLVARGFPTAYGIIGSFLAIMLWAYYAMIVIFFGAEYSRAAMLDERAQT